MDRHRARNARLREARRVSAPDRKPPAQLAVRRLGIDTQSEPVVFLHRNNPVSHAEGFEAHNRVLLRAGSREAIATLFLVTDDILADDVAGLSEAAWRRLRLAPDGHVTITHPRPVDSMSLVRGRIYGHELAENSLHAIIRDIAEERYSNLEIGAFLTACAANPLVRDEVRALTRAMVDAGDRLSWNADIVADKHSVGGLPGNRTTLIVVPIMAALGFVMPKTSSRAITSPAGTADTMEVLAPVRLGAADIHRVVEREGGCIVWGGAVRLSPADDMLIRVERALDIDTEGQMIASVLSKKIAAGATHLVLDMPVGSTAKVRDAAAAKALTDGLLDVAAAFGIHAVVVTGAGDQPIGRGIGPALEARDVLAVLRNEAGAPENLRERALVLAGALIELCGGAPKGEGIALARAVLADGRAWAKMQRICLAQGAMCEPPVAPHRRPVTAARDGRLVTIDNRKLGKLAKLAGAPEAKVAGVDLHVRLGDRIAAGMPLCTVHAEAPGELDYALDYAAANEAMFEIVA
ncbi:MAG: thymidine phosphorylase family protein [Proteobacteria bacterium]|nr:thymidine phosphorylase family protein [Pseudomonadota bacterium]